MRDGGYGFAEPRNQGGVNLIRKGLQVQLMENGNDQLLDGMDVFDEEGTKVGHVVKYDAALG